MTTLQQRAAPLIALVNAATPGPWKVFPVRRHGHGLPGIQIICHAYTDEREMSEHNGPAIAALPDLAALLREALAEIERLKTQSEKTQ